MNLSPLWAEYLTANTFPSIHWSSLGAQDAPDSEIFFYAAQHGFVIFTHDLDFGALLTKTRSSRPSVLQVRTQDVLPSAIGPLVLRSLQATHDALVNGALVTVDIKRSRIRMLPIKSATQDE